MGYVMCINLKKCARVYINMAHIYALFICLQLQQYVFIYYIDMYLSTQTIFR